MTGIAKVLACTEWRPVPFVTSLKTPEPVCLPPNHSMQYCEYFGNSAGYLLFSNYLVVLRDIPNNTSVVIPSPDEVIAKSYDSNSFGVSSNGIIGFWIDGMSGGFLEEFISVRINNSTTLRGLCISNNGTLELVTTTGQVVWDESRKFMFHPMAMETVTTVTYLSPTYTGTDAVESQHTALISGVILIVGLVIVSAAIAMRSGSQSPRRNIAEPATREESLPVYEEDISLESIAAGFSMVLPVDANLPNWSLEDVATWVRLNGGGHLGAETVRVKQIDGAVIEVTNVEELMALFELVENRVQLQQALKALKAPPAEVDAPPMYHESEMKI
ncbi:hypothetical protein BC830DRAFT_59442 [Chytriomyces sp. MP71]|nr:hypothetical protein BC830DRAFT_59442 [Chytriomyces sp. MP71]